MCETCKTWTNKKGSKSFHSFVKTYIWPFKLQIEHHWNGKMCESFLEQFNKPKPIQYSLAVMPTFMRDATRFVTSEIFGGQSVPSPIPWQVSILHNGGVFCGGTILDVYTVLSAGNCFAGHVNINGISIRAGSTQTSSGGQVSLSFAILMLIIYWCQKI